MKTRFGVAADWPIEYGALEPYYVRGRGIDRRGGPGRARRALALARISAATASPVLRGANARQGSRGTRPRLAGQQPARRCRCLGTGGACIMRRCNNGCPRGDKGSADVTFIAAAVATGRCTVRPESPVIRIEAGPGDHVGGRSGRTARRQHRTHRERRMWCWLAAPSKRRDCCLLPTGSATRAAKSDRTSWTRSLSLWGRCIPSRSTAAVACRAMPLRWDFNAPDAIPGVIGGCRFYNACGESELGGLAAFALRAVPGWGRAHAQSVRRLWGACVAHRRDQRAAA